MDTKAYNQTNYVQAIYVQVPISTSNVQNATSLEFSSSACLLDWGGGHAFVLKNKNKYYVYYFEKCKQKTFCMFGFRILFFYGLASIASSREG